LAEIHSVVAIAVFKTALKSIQNILPKLIMPAKSYLSLSKGSNQWYKYILFFVIFIVLASLFSVPAYFIKSKPNSYLSYFKLIFPSAILLPCVFITLKWVHNRSGFTLINAEKIRWERIFWAMGCFGGLTFLIEIFSWLINPSLYTFSFDKNTFFQYSIISVVLIPFQAAGEELLCRGYLMQGVAWATKKPWFALLFTSLLFGALHLANPELKKFGNIFILNYITTGLAMGIMTIMDDGTELAIGVHIVNNLYSAILITYPSSALKTSAIFTINEYNATFWTIAGLLSFIVFLIICQKKYQWSNFKSLFENLED
jgi:hypothetical protein